jgi:hypothetical protein
MTETSWSAAVGLRADVRNHLGWRGVRVGTLCLLAVAFAPATSTAADHHAPVVVVRGPTVVAFFPPVTQKELDGSPDTNEALSDFQLYARQARTALAARGVAFEELYTRSFRVSDGKRVKVFRPGSVRVGYYFAIPGKKSHLEYGVMTSDDLIDTAERYFAAGAPAR